MLIDAKVRALVVAMASVIVVLATNGQPVIEGVGVFATEAVAFPTDADVVHINSSTPQPVNLLIEALGRTNRKTPDGKDIPIVIQLCNVDLDLTGKSIELGSSRWLIAAPACARSLVSRGPRIRISDSRNGTALFVIRGDDVHIGGFRLEGPTSGIGAGSTLEKGIKIFPFSSRTPIRKIEISNMEIYFWSGAGIDVADNTAEAERGRLFNTNAGAVRIWNNYFHHNRHGSGHGYGVVVGGGGYAVVEQNVFDENRHAIAGGSKDSTGRDYSGYTIRDNLILPGGGVHCGEGGGWDILGVVTGWADIWPRCSQTHQIDMHGDDNMTGSSHNWLCGKAGETLIIERNTVLYDAGTAVSIRGNPMDRGVLDGNVFKHTTRSKAINQSGNCGAGDNITNPLEIRPNNKYGSNPMSQLGSCDFDGNGSQEQFLATGATWWVRSTTNQWRYLNTKPEVLSQLELRMIDSDRICDVGLPSRSSFPTAVAGPQRYVKSGVGPWQSNRPGVER